MELRAQAQKVQTELDRLTQLISELEVEDSADSAGASRRASGGDVSREAVLSELRRDKAQRPNEAGFKYGDRVTHKGDLFSFRKGKGRRGFRPNGVAGCEGVVVGTTAQYVYFFPDWETEAAGAYRKKNSNVKLSEF